MSKTIASTVVRSLPAFLLGPAAALILGCLPSPRSRAVDNSRCFVCHMNLEEEQMAVTHAKEGVGCETCHGRSDAHCNDENNTTAPDHMYARATINLACMKCHPSLSPRTDHKPILADPPAAKKVCTDCHGEHRLAHRTRHWDRTTGRLLDTK